MTKDENIKEVMELVDDWNRSTYSCTSAVMAASELGSSLDEIKYAEFAIEHTKMKRARLESKLREPIQ